MFINFLVGGGRILLEAGCSLTFLAIRVSAYPRLGIYLNEYSVK